MRKKKEKNLNFKEDQQKWGYIFMAPLVIGLSIFVIFPIIASLFYSLFDWVGFQDPTFIGLENFKTLLSDDVFIKAMLNTIKISIVVIPLSLLISLIVASLLNSKIKGVSIYRVIYYIPVITMPAAIALVWQYIFDPQFGIANYLLNAVGIESQGWFYDPSTSWILICFITIWGMIGFQIMILIAGMQNIPKSYYEAATVDGASTFLKFWKITIPMLSPTVFFLLITAFITAFQIFDMVYILVGPTPGIESARTIMYYFYDTAFVNGDKGYGSAIIVIVFLMLIFVSAIQFALQRKWVTYDRD